MKKAVLVLAGLLVVAIVAAGFRVWPKLQTWLHEVEEMVDRDTSAMEVMAKSDADWQPPTPQPDDRWFPAEIDGWKLTDGAPFTEVPELKLQRSGYGATYRRGGERIVAKALMATELERDALFGRAATKAKADEEIRSQSQKGQVIQVGEGRSEWQKPNFVEFSYQGGEQLFCRSFGKWFFYMQSHDGPDLKPFSIAWLKAIDGHKAP